MRLQQILRPRLQYVETQLSEGAAEHIRQQLDQLRPEHDSLGQQLATVTGRLSEYNEKVSGLHKERAEIEQKLEEAQACWTAYLHFLSIPPASPGFIFHFSSFIFHIQAINS